MYISMLCRLLSNNIKKTLKKKEKGSTEDKGGRVKMRKAMTEDELESWINDDIHYCHLGKFL